MFFAAFKLSDPEASRSRRGVVGAVTMLHDLLFSSRSPLWHMLHILTFAPP